MLIRRPDEAITTALDQVDLYDPTLYAVGDAHALWCALRKHDPVHWQQLPDCRGFWSVTRYADVRLVLTEHELFTSEGGNLLANLGSPDPASGKILTSTDPPAHAGVRKPLARLFSRQNLAPHEPYLRETIRQFLRPLTTGASWDLAAAAATLPVAFVAPLMGIPQDDWEKLARYATMAVAPDDQEFMDGNARRTVMTAHFELFDYLAGSVDRHRCGVSNDVVQSLFGAELSGRPLENDEIVYNCYSVLLGAGVTAPHAMAATVLALIESPDAYARLRSRPELISSAVEEGLRWSSPANHFVRHATQDISMHGVTIRAGQAVAAWIGSANFDELVFVDPFRFDVARHPNRHLAFGAGAHYCLGAPLARLMLRYFLEELIEVAEGLALAGPVEHLCSNFIAGIKHLPVRLAGPVDPPDHRPEGQPVSYPPSG